MYISMTVTTPHGLLISQFLSLLTLCSSSGVMPILYLTMTEKSFCCEISIGAPWQWNRPVCRRRNRYDVHLCRNSIVFLVCAVFYYYFTSFFFIVILNYPSIDALWKKLRLNLHRVTRKTMQCNCPLNRSFKSILGMYGYYISDHDTNTDITLQIKW